jgi:hypothetical protein
MYGLQSIRGHDRQRGRDYVIRAEERKLTAAGRLLQTVGKSAVHFKARQQNV